jgi:hypothetical protein
MDRRSGEREVGREGGREGTYLGVAEVGVEATEAGREVGGTEDEGDKDVTAAWREGGREEGGEGGLEEAKIEKEGKRRGGREGGREGGGEGGRAYQSPSWKRFDA